MRGQHERLVLANLLDDLTDHWILIPEFAKPVILFFLLDALQQLFNPCLPRRRSIELKENLGSMAQSQSLHQLMPGGAAGGIEPLQSLLSFSFCAVRFHKYARRFAVRSKQYLAHCGQPDAWVDQLALDQGPNLFAQSVGHTLAAMLYIAVLHDCCKGGLVQIVVYRLFYWSLERSRRKDFTLERRGSLDIPGKFFPENIIQSTGYLNLLHRYSTQASVMSAPVELAMRWASRSTFCIRPSR